MNKRPYVIATSLVLLLTTVCLNLSPDSSARLKRALSSFFIPLFSLQEGAETAGGALVDHGAPRSVLLTELRDLKQTNQFHLGRPVLVMALIMCVAGIALFAAIATRAV